MKTHIKEGDLVNYWKGIATGKPDGQGVITSFGILNGDTEVAFIEGCRGCIALTHIEKVE